MSKTLKDIQRIKYNAHLPQFLHDDVVLEIDNWKKTIKSLYKEVLDTKNWFKLLAADRVFRRYNEVDYPWYKEDKEELLPILYRLLVHPEVSHDYQIKIGSNIIALIKTKEYDLNIVLDWRPFYEMLKRYYFKKNRTLLYTPPEPHAFTMMGVLDRVRIFFDKNATDEILDEFRPMLCPHDHVCFISQGFLCSFLPTNRQRTDWLPEIFAMWEWIDNSPYWDVNIFKLLARLAKESPGIVDWKPYLPIIFTHILRSLNLPIGGELAKYDRFPLESCELFGHYGLIKQKLMENMARLIVALLTPEGEEMKYFEKLINSIEVFYHPSNGGYWSSDLGLFLSSLCAIFASRLKKECEGDTIYPKNLHLTDDLCTKFVNIVFPVSKIAIFSKNSAMTLEATQSIKHLAFIKPQIVFPSMMDKITHALTTLTETHQTLIAIELMAQIIYPLLNKKKEFPEGKNFLGDLLNLSLPGIDSNDRSKTYATLNFYSSMLLTVPICTSIGPRKSMESIEFDEGNDDDGPPNAIEFFEDWCHQFLSRIFDFLSSQSEPSKEKKHAFFSSDELSPRLLYGVTFMFYQQLSIDLYKTMAKKVMDFVKLTFLPNAVKQIGVICTSVASSPYAPLVLPQFIQMFYDKLVDKSGQELNNLNDTESHYYLYILSKLLKGSNVASTIIEQKKPLLTILSLAWKSKTKKLIIATGKLLKHMIQALTRVYAQEYRSVDEKTWESSEFCHWETWGEPGNLDNLNIKWHIPTDQEIDFAVELYNTFIESPITELNQYLEKLKNKKSLKSNRDEIVNALLRLHYCISAAFNFLPEITKDVITEYSRKPRERPLNTGLIRMKNEQAKYTRYDIGVLLHNFAQEMIKSTEDETAILEELIENIEILCCRNRKKYKYLEKLRTHQIVKTHLFKSTNKKREYPRGTLIQRVSLLMHVRRFSEVIPCCKIHVELLKDLQQLSLAEYSKVRTKAQKVFALMAKQFKETLIKSMLPSLIDNLTDKNITPEQLTGTLYLLQEGDIIKKITEDWNLLSKMAIAICTCTQIEKPSDQKRFNKLFIYFTLNFRELKLDYPEVKPGEISHAEKYMNLVNNLIGIVKENPSIHWKYQLMICTILILLIRSDRKIMFPIEATQFLLKCLLSDILQLRSGAVKALLLIFSQYKPYQRRKQIEMEKTRFTFEDAAKMNNNVPKNEEEWKKTIFFDKNYFGWYRLPKKATVYVYDENEECEKTDKYGKERQEFIDKIKPMLTSEFFEQFFYLFALQPRTSNVVFHDQMAQFFKGLFQIFGYDLLEIVKPHLEKLLSHCGSAKPEERNNLALAAECIGGLVRATKHWEFNKREATFNYLKPLLKNVLTNCSQHCIDDWMECTRFCVYDLDVRRCRWLIDFLIEQIDLETGTSATQHRALRFLFPALSEVSWRDLYTIQRVLKVMYKNLHHPYQQVRELISKTISIITRYYWQFPRDPNTDLATLGELPIQKHVIDMINVLKDEMDSKKEHVKEADLKNLQKTVIGTMAYTVQTGSFLSIVPYLNIVLPMVLQNYDKYKEDDDIQLYSKKFLGLTASSLCTQSAVDKIVELLDIGLKSESWRIRYAITEFTQVFAYRHQFYLLDKPDLIFDRLIVLLSDKSQEVRDLTCNTLAGFIKITESKKVEKLVQYFTKKLKKKGKVTDESLIERHAAVLGIAAIVRAYPYEVPEFMPELLVLLADYSSEKAPIGPTVKKTFADFWKTHVNDWYQVHKHKFNEDQLYIVTAQTGSYQYYV